jgi:hypothetical protein
MPAWKSKKQLEQTHCFNITKETRLKWPDNGKGKKYEDVGSNPARMQGFLCRENISVLMCQI